MSEKRAGIILMRRYADAVNEMSLEDAGSLLKAVYAYDAGKDVPEMSPFVRAVYLTIRADMDEHAERYAEVCERNKRNAQKRWGKQTDMPVEDACGRCQEKRREEKGIEAKGGEGKICIYLASERMRAHRRIRHIPPR